MIIYNNYMAFKTVSADQIPCYNDEIEWPPHAVVTMHVANEFVSTDATHFYWLTTQIVIAELFLRLNK